MSGRWKSAYGECGAITRRGTACRCMAVRPGGRCRFHGGLSTGPKTLEGRVKALRQLRPLAHLSEAELRARAAELLAAAEKRVFW
jgi:hypothetical protein